MRPSLAFSQVGRFPLSLDGNLHFPSGKYGLPKVEWLQMIGLISTKVISTSWLNTLSIASPWLPDQQMGLPRTARHPNPAAMVLVGAKVTVQTPEHIRGVYTARKRVKGTSDSEWAVRWDTKLL